VEGLIGVIASRTESLSVRNVFLFLAISQSSIFIWNSGHFFVIESLAELSHLSNSLYFNFSS
jgi:hypothetical protein